MFRESFARFSLASMRNLRLSRRRTQNFDTVSRLSSPRFHALQAKTALPRESVADRRYKGKKTHIRRRSKLIFLFRVFFFDLMTAREQKCVPTAAFGGFSPEISRESFAKFCLEGCESVKSNFPLEGAKFLQRPSPDPFRCHAAQDGCRRGKCTCR